MTWLEGRTEGGTVLPVQITEDGRLVAQGLVGSEGPPGPPGEQGPQGEYGPGDDVDLGSATIEGNGRQPDESPLIINNTNVDGYNIYSKSNGTGSFAVSAGGAVYIGDNASPNIALLSNGSASFAGTVSGGTAKAGDFAYI